MRRLSDAQAAENIGVAEARDTVVSCLSGENKVALPDALTPFHLASQDERHRRVREVLVRAYELFRGGGMSMVASINAACVAPSSPAGEYAKIVLRRILLELNLTAWEEHPARLRSEIHSLFKRAIGRVTPHKGGWNPSDAPRRKRNMSRAELLAHVERRSTPCPLTGCWLWVGAVTNGYARMAWGEQKSGTVTRFLLGLTPDDPREALHTCDCPPCVNPTHLTIGTHRQNMRDMAKRGRAATGPRGERKQGPYHPGLWRRL